MPVIEWRDRHTVLVLCTLSFFATMVARVVISPVVPDLTAGFGVSTGSIGLALSGMWAAYALTQFPSGLLGDRYGERIVVLAGVGGTAVASLLLALSPSYLSFLLFAVALGGAAGLVYSVATSLVTKRSAATGRAIGLLIVGGPAAGLAAPPVAAAVGARYGWRAAVALGVLVAVPAFVLFARLVEPTPAARPDRAVREQLDVERAVELLSRPAIARTTALAVLGAFTWQATASFLPAFLEEFHGHSRATASLLFSWYFLVHGLAQPVTGALSDRYSRDATAGLTMFTGIVGYWALVAAPSTLAVVAAIALVGVAMSWGAPLQSRFMDNLSDEERGTGFGLVRTLYMSLGALGSVVTGALADAVGWRVAFGLLVVCMAAGTGILVAGRLDARRTDTSRDDSSG